MIMKTNNIFRFLAAMAVAFGIAACEDDSKLNGEGPDTPDGPSGPSAVVPNFPDLVEDYAVLPGSTQELVFTPNLAWEVSIPNEIRQWFWIKDDAFTVTSLKGDASKEPVKVYIGVTPNAEFDKNYSCEVTLAMGDTSKVIAKYMLPAKEKTLDVYMAQKNEDGSFKLADDGVTYLYETTPVTDAELVWSAEFKKFILPVRVVSNCEWSMSKPDWADVNVPEKTAEIVDLLITGFSLEAADGRIAFTNGETELKVINVAVPQGKDMTIYSAVLGEDGYESDGDAFLWNENPAEKLELTWSGADFRLPVLIDAKCNWTVALPEWLAIETYPELEELPAETAGQIVALIKGVPTKYPLEDTEGKIAFKAGNDLVCEIPVSIPGCKDIMTYSLNMNLTALEYNYLGHIKTSLGFAEEVVTGNVFGTKDVKAFAVETTGGKVGEMLSGQDAWFNVEMSAYVDAKEQNVLQERTLTFTVKENNGTARSAALFVLPPSVDVKFAELFNEDASVKEEYLEWYVPVTQGSKDYDDYITVSSGEGSDTDYTFEKASEDRKNELSSIFGETDYAYVVTYFSSGCYLSLSMPIVYESFRIFDADGNDMSGKEDFWLRYKTTGMNNSYGELYMYPEMNLPLEASIGYVVFYDDKGNVLAIVECVSPYEPPYLTVDKTELVFTADASENKIQISSNVDWTAETDADWCVLEPSSGSRDGVLTVSVNKNEIEEVRRTEIIIRSATMTQVVAVEQKFGEVLETDISEIHFTCLEASVTLNITSNISWKLESDSDWCTVTQNAGSGNAEVSVAVSMNRSESDRVAVLTLSSENVSKSILVKQDYDDGSVTNGDDYVHFLDWTAAKDAGAMLLRLTSGEIYEEYKNGEIPIYHLIYTQESTPLRVVIPSEVFKHNVNPWVSKTLLRVNDTIYDEYRGPNMILGEVVKDADNSVAIYMDVAEGSTFMRGNINFTTKTGNDPVVILVCTIDLNAK